MFYNNMEVNCKVFSSKQDWRIRVVFREDGAPVFCALDVASSMGFMAPQKAVARFKGELVVAPIPWNNTARKGCSAMRCLTERSLMVFIKDSSIQPAPGFIQWVETVVVPGAKEFATETDVGRNSPAPSFAAAHAPAPEPLKIPAGQPNIAKQIDDIIFDLMVLKKNLA